MRKLTSSQKAEITETVKRKFESGATRSGDDEGASFELICPSAFRRLAQRYRLGEMSHGAENWTKGLPMLDVLKHIKSHLTKWEQGEKLEDDNLAAVAWGVFALMHFESNCQCHTRRNNIRKLDKKYLENQ